MLVAAAATAGRVTGGGLQGPSNAQLKQDSDAFESARKDWSGMTASGRGKVGGAGEGSNVNWLG